MILALIIEDSILLHTGNALLSMWNSNLRWQVTTHVAEMVRQTVQYVAYHDDVIKWKNFLRYWPFVGESIGHRWIPLTKASESLMFSFISARINGWANNRVPGDLRRHRAHYDVTVMGFFAGFVYYSLIHLHSLCTLPSLYKNKTSTIKLKHSSFKGSSFCQICEWVYSCNLILKNYCKVS